LSNGGSSLKKGRRVSKSGKLCATRWIAER
jgi:hypothetical protein